MTDRTAYSYIRELTADDPEDMPPLTHRMTMEAQRVSDEWPKYSEPGWHYPYRNEKLYMARAHDLASHIGGSTYDWRHDSLDPPSTMWSLGRRLKRCRETAGAIHTTLTHSGLDWVARMDARQAAGKERPEFWSPEWVEEQQSFADDPKLLAFTHVNLFDLIREIKRIPMPTELRTARGARGYRESFRYGWDYFFLAAEFARTQGCLWTVEWDIGAHVRAHTRLDLACDQVSNAISHLEGIASSWNYRQRRIEDRKFIREHERYGKAKRQAKEAKA